VKNISITLPKGSLIVVICAGLMYLSFVITNIRIETVRAEIADETVAEIESLRREIVGLSYNLRHLEMKVNWLIHHVDGDEYWPSTQ
jgi:hypothetical protein